MSYTKRGRSAFSPVTVTYSDGASTSSKFIIEDCIIQHTPALNAQNHTYAKEFVFIGIPTVIIDKNVNDAATTSQLTLQNKPNVRDISGYYWQRCNLDKLSHRDTNIVTETGSCKMSLDQMLKEVKKGIVANVMFTLSGSMTSNIMDEELDLKDGTYTITMKPTEVYGVSTTDIKGPELTDTNHRKTETAAVPRSSMAKGDLLNIAMKRLNLSKK